MFRSLDLFDAARDWLPDLSITTSSEFAKLSGRLAVGSETRISSRSVTVTPLWLGVEHRFRHQPMQKGEPVGVKPAPGSAAPGVNVER